MKKSTEILPHPFILAPIAEVTTPALRRAVRMFCKETIICSEMLSAPSVVRGGVRNESLMKKYEFDDPFVYQIMGNDPGIMAEAASMLAESGCLGIDINMGCSAPDIIKRGCGSFLLKDIKLAQKIVKACRSAIDCNLSVKLRSGYTHTDEKHLFEISSMLQSEGIDYITLHGRHGKMAFKRKADWSLVKILKEKLRIPVIGNGDIVSAEMAVERLVETGCDGIMIARQAVAEPWLFKVATMLYRNERQKFSVNIEEVCLQVLDDLENILPRELHKSRARRYLSYFTKNVVFGHQLFTRIRNVETIKDMRDFVVQYFKRNPEECIRKFF
jgi:nifR3 family TIM-barrel protein